MGLAKQMMKRLAMMERAVEGRPRAGQFDVIQAVPVINAGGWSPGLYRAGPEGSTAGVLVYDAEAGKPVLPEGRLTRHGLFMVCEPASFQPGIDYAE